MKIKDLRKKNSTELAKDLKERKQSLHDFKFGISGSKVKNMKEGKNLRREIARIKTLLKEEKKA